VVALQGWTKAALQALGCKTLTRGWDVSPAPGQQRAAICGFSVLCVQERCARISLCAPARGGLGHTPGLREERAGVESKGS